MCNYRDKAPLLPIQNSNKKKLSTNLSTSKWKPDQTKLCTFCKSQAETIAHILYECEIVYAFWGKIIDWVKREFELEIAPSKFSTLFNAHKGLRKKSDQHDNINSKV